MSNYYYGQVTVKGYKEAIKKFIERFPLQAGDKLLFRVNNEKKFPECFLHDYYDVVMSNFNEQTKNISYDTRCSFTFKVHFKENAFECFLGKFQQQHGSQCVDLVTICKTFTVDVDIWNVYYTYDYFELFLSCNKFGKITRNERYEMQTYKCNKCGGKRPFGPFEKTYKCARCNNTGVQNWTKTR